MTKKIKHWLGICLGLVILSLNGLGLVSAQELIQGFKTDTNLEKGMIVGIDPDDGEKVIAINNNYIEDMFGVVVEPSDAPFTLSSNETSVYVATKGNYNVLVSDANGGIKAGDHISLSGIPGIGQKASDTQVLIIGKALQDYIPNEGSVVLSTATDGAGRTYNIGKIVVSVTVGQNPILRPDTNVPDFLERAGELVADKPVSPVRLYISLVILLLVAAISGSLIYASVRSSITAIGRNPLSKKTITRSLMQVVMVAFLILLSGLFTVYILLRL